MEKGDPLKHSSGKAITVLLLVILNIPILFAQNRDSYTLGFSETLLSNNILWGFNRYIQQSDYGMISAESIRTNLSSSWVWDQDEFVINHWGHPYQGSVYFSAGRSAGNDFWSSASLTVLGSVSWELFMETETPSKNDLIMTTFGGVTLGEMFYRLSDVIRYGRDGNIEKPGVVRQFGAAVMSPYRGINQIFRPESKAPPSEITGYHSLGAGRSFFQVNLLSDTDPLVRNDGNDLSYSVNLQYGDPYTKWNSDPFDSFTIDLGLLFSYENETYLRFFTEGLLYGRPIYHNSDVKQSLGLYLNYDFILNRIINLGANGLGLGWFLHAPLGKNWTWNSRIYLNYIFMGASDIIFLKYNDIWLSEPDYERRNYSLCTGENLKTRFSLTWKDTWNFSFFYTLYNFFIIDSSVPEDGASGKELIGVGNLTLRRHFTENFYVGVSGAFYHKESFYDNYSNLHEQISGYTVFYGFDF